MISCKPYCIQIHGGGGRDRGSVQKIGEACGTEDAMNLSSPCDIAVGGELGRNEGSNMIHEKFEVRGDDEVIEGIGRGFRSRKVVGG